MTGNHLDKFAQAPLTCAEGLKDPHIGAQSGTCCQCSSAGAAGATTGIIRG